MNYLVSRKNGETIYSQISKALRNEILEHYRLGDCLPAEPQLAELFAVNRHTIRRAVDVLIAEGIVQRQHGRGTFVTAPLQYPITKGTRFTENLARFGGNIGTLLLRKLIIPARGGIAQKLRLDDESPVIWLETLRMVAELPFCIASHFLPHEGLAFVMDQYEGGSLHQLFLARNIVPVRRLSLITSQLPVGEDAEYLKMPRNQPVLRVKSVNVNGATANPVEYCVTRFRADRVELNVAIHH